MPPGRGPEACSASRAAPAWRRARAAPAVRDRRDGPWSSPTVAAIAEAVSVSGYRCGPADGPPRRKHLRRRVAATGNLRDDAQDDTPPAAGRRSTRRRSTRSTVGCPLLAPRLPVTVPTPLARGEPGEGYPFPWSVYRWIDGETARVERIADLTGSPVRSPASWPPCTGRSQRAGRRPGAQRLPGASLTTYEGRPAGGRGARRPDSGRYGHRDLGEGRARHRAGPPVWFDGDVAWGNLWCGTDGWRPSSTSCCGTGDPACDLAVGWTSLSGASRAAFRAALAVDDDTWAWGRAGCWEGPDHARPSRPGARGRGPPHARRGPCRVRGVPSPDRSGPVATNRRGHG